MNGRTVTEAGASSNEQEGCVLVQDSSRILAEHDLFKSVLDKSANGVAIVSPDGLVEYANDRLVETYGISKGQLIGKDWQHLMSIQESWRDKLTDVRETVLVRKKTWETPIKDISPSGNGGWRKVRVFPILDKGGEVAHIVSLSEDITEMTEMAVALRESENSFRALAESAGDGITIASPNEVYFCNRRMSEISGYTVEELHTAEVAIALLPPDEYAKVKVYMRKRLSGQDAPPQYRTVLVQKDGSMIPIELSVALTMWQGKPASLAITRDISERVEMEKKLRQSEKMEAIGQLAGGVAHDFNNQLGVIVGFADMLKEELEGNPALTRYVDAILTGAQRASDLTNQLLAFAKKGKYLTQTVDVHRLINEICGLLSHSIDKRIAITQSLNASSPLTEGDSSQLQNALLNLAVNARDAMPDGGELKFETGSEHFGEEHCRKAGIEVDPGDYVRISVIDTGSGMDDEIQRRMFEPFFTTKKDGKGTGMGLAAVYGTVNAHRGMIDVCSQQEEGTAVTVWLPLSGNGQKATSIPREKDAISGKGTVLLVDDEANFRDMGQEMLRSLGYKVLTAKDGEEAVASFKKYAQGIDLVILDMVMPKMGGEAAFVAMQTIDPHVCVLISSGYSVDNAAADVLRRGAKGFLQKPYTRRNLSEAVHRAMKG